LKLVQQKLGLPLLSHHKVGRHSVASQAVTGGESVKAVQAQLGHRSEQSTHQYAHLGSETQRRLVEALKPARAPHEAAAQNGHGNWRQRALQAPHRPPSNKSKKAPFSQGLFVSCAGAQCGLDTAISLGFERWLVA
jgi:hypothetical protein